MTRFGTQGLLFGAATVTAAGLIGSATIAAAVATANLSVLVAVALLRVVIARGGRRTTPRCARRDGALPFVSIHVPTCNEPAAVVLRTLRALERLNYPAFEVIVLDNNTTDPALWRPLERFCASVEASARFHFIHKDALEGAKAGALNLCRQLADPRTELILTVDADYRVDPDILRHALPYFDDPTVSHVQFPQAYFNGTDASAGLTDDYAHYFELYMPFADAARAALLTGTLSVIRVDALDAVGGWRPSSITEDAELGARLIAAGFSGRYAPRVAGRGMMPTDLGSLRKQRRRWAFGNAQTLFSIPIATWRRLGGRRALAVVAQLTAWFNFLLVPMGVLLASAVAGDSHVLAAWVAVASVLVSTAGKLVTFGLPARHVDARRPRNLGKALGAHLGTLWEGATGWLEALCGVRLGFIRTDKFEGLGSVRHALPALLVGAALFAAAWGLAAQGQPAPAIAAGLLGASALCALYTQRQLARVARTARPLRARLTERTSSLGPAHVRSSSLPAKRGGHDPAVAQHHHPHLQPSPLRGPRHRGGAQTEPPRVLGDRHR